MKTTSVLIQSLCVPCYDYCRYCLLSWNGKIVGADWDRSVRLAERFMDELRNQQPELKRGFSFGYSMEHPNLQGAIRTLHRLGGPTAEYLQCDGMKMRQYNFRGEALSGGYLELWPSDLLTGRETEEELARHLYFEGLNPHSFYDAFHEFDTQTVQESLQSEDQIVRLFALLDRRVGKRTLQKLREGLDAQTPAFRRFWAIRMAAGREFYVENLKVE